jgi:hypothetical protein
MICHGPATCGYFIDQFIFSSNDTFLRNRYSPTIFITIKHDV